MEQLRDNMDDDINNYVKVNGSNFNLTQLSDPEVASPTTVIQGKRKLLKDTSMANDVVAVQTLTRMEEQTKSMMIPGKQHLSYKKIRNEAAYLRLQEL